MDDGRWWVARPREAVETLYRSERVTEDDSERPIEGDRVPQHHDGILIIDFGSQYTQLIARRVREAHVYCEIHPPSRIDPVDPRLEAPRGSSSRAAPTRCTSDSVPTADPALLELGTPVLGLCYGMQLLAHLSGGNVRRAGPARVRPGQRQGRRRPALPGLRPRARRRRSG